MTYESSVDEASAAARHRIKGGEIISAWLSVGQIDMCTWCAVRRRACVILMRYTVLHNGLS